MNCLASEKELIKLASKDAQDRRTGIGGGERGVEYGARIGAELRNGFQCGITVN